MWLAKSVIPECNVDSCLFNVLLQFGKDGVNHTKGNTTVVKKVVEKFDDLFCVAIIDKDRRDLEFIQKECDRIFLEDGLDDYFVLYKRKDRHHYFIQMVPAIEEWIMKVCVELEINLSETILSVSTLVELKELTKSTSSKHDDRFVQLFKMIIRRAEEYNYLPVLKLKRVIEYLLDKKYNVEINELKNV